ncbi:MAG: AAA family ATPase [Dehalococcoidia bacterium]|jgi:hypothetical protein|nr:AAA family ATPase [Dehalococcoidia bacterium]
MPSTSLHDIKTLIASLHPLLAIETVEEERVRGLLATAGSELGLPIFEWSVTSGLKRTDQPNAAHNTASPLGLMKHLATLRLAGIFHLKDFASHLQDATVVRSVREAVQQFAKHRSTLVLTGDPIELPQVLTSHAVQFRLHLPNAEELRAALATSLKSLKARHRINVAIEPDDLERLVRALRGLTLSQARQAVSYAILEDRKLDADDITTITERKARMLEESGPIEYFPTEENRFELGGFDKLKAWLERASLGFGPKAAALNLTPPRGVLIVGVQGCGKSLAAKVIARTWKLPLLKLDAGRLYDKFVGESEKNLRRATQLAESMAPVVLWIDEIEKGLGATGGSEADGGLSRRLVGSFLTWQQERKAEVFVVATANDLDVLPPEMLRKGRFDEIFFVDLPDAEERQAIVTIHLNLRNQDPEAFDLARLVAATEGFSGAEIEQAVIAALYRALHGERKLDTDLLLQELAETVPLSVSRREDIARLRQRAKGRFVPVS